MSSSADERLKLITELYRFVAPALWNDIAAAQSFEEVNALRENLHSLEDMFVRAQRMNLGAEGTAVEAANAAATAASAAVQRSFETGAALSTRITAVAAAVRAIEHLLNVADDDDGFGGPRFQ